MSLSSVLHKLMPYVALILAFLVLLAIGVLALVSTAGYFRSAGGWKIVIAIITLLLAAVFSAWLILYSS